MNAINLAHSAYGSASIPARTPRSSERAVIEQVTARMFRASQTGASFAQKAEAVFDNQKLWIALAADVADRNNSLPQALRAQLFYLAEFTQIYSRKILNEKASIEPLIEINRAIMSGLRGQQEVAR